MVTEYFLDLNDTKGKMKLLSPAELRFLGITSSILNARFPLKDEFRGPSTQHEDRVGLEYFLSGSTYVQSEIFEADLNPEKLMHGTDTPMPHVRSFLKNQASFGRFLVHITKSTDSCSYNSRFKADHV